MDAAFFVLGFATLWFFAWRAKDHTQGRREPQRHYPVFAQCAEGHPFDRTENVSCPCGEQGIIYGRRQPFHWEKNLPQENRRKLRIVR